MMNRILALLLSVSVAACSLAPPRSRAPLVEVSIPDSRSDAPEPPLAADQQSSEPEDRGPGQTDRRPDPVLGAALLVLVLALYLVAQKAIIDASVKGTYR
ncbi:MAG: hypothetical protein IT529_00210 [Burkholderiales bacterium]|nr:hypothetical protein [Burkholderiales bacterium]